MKRCFVIVDVEGSGEADEGDRGLERQGQVVERPVVRDVDNERGDGLTPVVEPSREGAIESARVTRDSNRMRRRAWPTK